ncbi:tetratricopeptide repeat protein [Aureibacter tunicatorum]|uniref:Tetratricopeptide (TPR) repeat protein n=1 Tax=Aureibacter tunicatorum TaxID=866807 RepID=A0AAE4BSK0_9BACT|nr:tetratricopeptide repeat protein [Aureibacter tunicatorum]MDR6238903.1 tetratricopeptide (TPR) repeat protein [Aureibacter tunicatorum]BDD05170.1 hypothetical protein AUTU_26530 [Aureibacter tunicatorum]
MRKSLLLLFSILLTQLSYACLNEYKTLLNGKVVYEGFISGKVRTKEIDSLKLKKQSENLLKQYLITDSIAYYSDYATTLTYLGEYQKAKTIFIEIEQNSPHLYTTASNLGTIYELIGKPDSALIWIKKSIALNPNSHNGSEWIHIKILEYKLSGKSDVNMSILDLDFGNNKIPENTHNYDLNNIRNHIFHQLEERTIFVKPENKIVGNLFFDLGNVLAITWDVQTALESYEEARKYGFNSELMKLRSKEFEKLALKTVPYQILMDNKNLIRKYWIPFIIISILSLYFLLKSIKKRKSN